MKDRTVHIKSDGGNLKLIILEPGIQRRPVPGILWIHGGGYITGMASMVYVSCGKALAEKFGAVVVSPEYRLAWRAPYPAALRDCYAALEYMWDNAQELGIDRGRIVVGGESAGGGLAAAVCIYARDKGRINPVMQIPLYPMLDCYDTPSSEDNTGKVWNTKRNHFGWRHYLGDLYGTDGIPAYASPSRETDYSGLPPCYTYVCDGEPFYCETLKYVDDLRRAGVPANVDVYPGDVHAFDEYRFWTESAKDAKQRVAEAYEQTVMKGDPRYYERQPEDK